MTEKNIITTNQYDGSFYKGNDDVGKGDPGFYKGNDDVGKGDSGFYKGNDIPKPSHPFFLEPPIKIPDDVLNALRVVKPEINNTKPADPVIPSQTPQGEPDRSGGKGGRQ